MPGRKQKIATDYADHSVLERIVEACPLADYRGRKVLMIVPDGTRTAPIGLMFHTIHKHLGEIGRAHV